MLYDGLDELEKNRKPIAAGIIGAGGGLDSRGFPVVAN
jgi:hypothetical protein